MQFINTIISIQFVAMVTGEIDYAELATAAGTVATPRQQVLLLHHETRCPVALGFPADNFQMIGILQMDTLVEGDL